jgi:hypothetical protein
MGCHYRYRHGRIDAGDPIAAPRLHVRFRVRLACVFPGERVLHALMVFPPGGDPIRRPAEQVLSLVHG